MYTGARTLPLVASQPHNLHWRRGFSAGAATRSAPACPSSSLPERTVPGETIPGPWAGRLWARVQASLEMAGISKRPAPTRPHDHKLPQGGEALIPERSCGRGLGAHPFSQHKERTAIGCGLIRLGRRGYHPQRTQSHRSRRRQSLARAGRPKRAASGGGARPAKTGGDYNGWGVSTRSPAEVALVKST